MKQKIINDRLNLGQAMDIKKICQIIEKNNNLDFNGISAGDSHKLLLSVFNIKDLNLKDTKKSGYHLTKLIYHITCYALENNKFRDVIQLDNDKVKTK